MRSSLSWHSTAYNVLMCRAAPTQSSLHCNAVRLLLRAELNFCSSEKAYIHSWWRQIRSVASLGADAGGTKTTWKLFVPRNMTRNNTTNKDQVAATELPQLLLHRPPNKLAVRLCRLKLNWKKQMFEVEEGTWPSAPQLVMPTALKIMMTMIIKVFQR